MQLPYINLPQSQAPQIIGDMGDTLVNAARRKKEDDQKAAEMLLQKQRLDADRLRMQAEEHRAAAEETRARAQEQRAHDTDERAKKLEAAQFVAQAPGMLDPNAPGYNPSQFQALGQIHGISAELQQPQLPPNPGQPGAAPQEPQSPMVGPLETPEGARNRAVSENVAGAGQGQPMQQPDAAAQEVLKQQTERDQYQQALAAHPELVKQHAAQVGQFKAYQAAQKQAEQDPIYNLHTPFGDSPLDFSARHQVQASRQQAQQQATEQAYGPEYAKVAAMAQQMGITDPNALAGMLNKAHEADQKRIEQEKLRADANGEKEKLKALYDLTAGQKFQVGMAGAGSRGVAAAHADDRQARTQFHADIAKDAGVIEKEYKTPYVESKKALRVVDSQPNNPEAWIAARDFFVKAASGGKVTKAQYDQAASHSAPAYDKLAQLFESATTGLPSETQRKNLHDALDAINKVAGQSLQEKQREFAATYGEDPLVSSGDKTAAGTYERHAKRLFSETEEPRTKPANPLVQAANHPKTAPVGETKVAPNGKTYRKVGPNDWQLVND